MKSLKWHNEEAWAITIGAIVVGVGAFCFYSPFIFGVAIGQVMTAWITYYDVKLGTDL